MTHRLALPLILAVLVGCAESDVRETEVAAGTGSSGGNPSSVAFQLVTDDAPDGSTWSSGFIAAGQVTAWRDAGGGVCRPNETAVPLGAFIDLLRGDRSSIDMEGLCGIVLRPAGDVPLVEITGVFGDVPVELELYLEGGVDLRFDDAPLPAAASARDYVVALEVGALVRNLDLIGRIRDREPDGALRLSDRDDVLGAQLVENLVMALTIFADPTPGDGRVTRAERVPANRVGGAVVP